MKKLEEYVRSIPDFPEPGIIFRDVTSILQDADGLHLAVDSLIHMVEDLDYDVVIGPESMVKAVTSNSNVLLNYSYIIYLLPQIQLI